MPSIEEIMQQYQEEEEVGIKTNRSIEDIANEAGVILSQQEPKTVNKPEEGYFAKAKEAYRQSNPLEMAKGAVRGGLSTAYGMGNLLEKASAKITGQKPLGEVIAGKPVEKPKSLTFSGQDTLGSKIGFAGEQFAEFLAPGTAPLKVANALSAGIKISKLAKATNLLARAGTEALTFGGQTAVQQGEFGDEAKSAAAFGAAIPIAGKVIPAAFKFAKSGTKGLLGKSTGAGVAALEEAYANPNVIKFAREAGVEGAEGLQRKAAEAGKEGLEKLLAERSAAYTSKLEKIKTNKTQLDDVAVTLRNKAEELMSKEKFDIQVVPTEELGKKTNIIDFSKSVITEGQPTVEKALNDVFTWTDWTPKGMDLLKKRLSDFKKQTKYGTPARALVNDLWFGLREQLESKVPGYKEMTKEYSVVSDLVEEMEAALSLGEKSKIDTTVRKFMSIMRDNNEIRKGFAKQLGELAGKDITGMMAGSQLAASMPRGLAGGTVSLGTGALGAASIINPSTLPAALIYLAGSSPRLVGELVSLLGKGGRALNKAKMSPALNNALKRILGGADEVGEKELPAVKAGKPIEKALPLKSKERTLEGFKTPAVGETAPKAKPKDNDKLYGAVAGIEIEKDENGKYKANYSPTKGVLGMAGIMAGKKAVGFPKARNLFSSLTDKKTRFEISDKIARVLPDQVKKLFVHGETTLGKLLNHSSLYKNYPELKNVIVKTSKESGASFNQEKNLIKINEDFVLPRWGKVEKGVDLESLKKTLLHEIQHSIQSIEGFARGGNPSDVLDTVLSQTYKEKITSPTVRADLLKKAFKDRDNYSSMLNNIRKSEWDSSLDPKMVKKERDSIIERLKMLQDATDLSPTAKVKAYMRLSGEVEARDVSARASLTPLQRIKQQPLKSQNIPLADQIIDKGNQEMYGAVAGFQPEYDEDGKLTKVNFDPKMAAIGILSMSTVKNKGKLLDRLKNRSLASKEEIMIKDGNKIKNSIIRPNADPHYKITVDPDTICPKRVMFGNTVKQVEVNLGKKLNQDEIYQLRNIMKENGSQVPCPQCYVEAARAKGFNAKALNEEGSYYNEIKRFSPEKVQDLNKHAGLRFFSSTDFKPQFIDNSIKVIRDAQAKGLKSHTYTKQFKFLDVFGESGIETNISIAGDIKNGKLVENLDMGVEWKKAMEYRKKMKNVATAFVAKTREEIKAALANPQIDHIIPFHASGQSKKNMALWGAVDDFTRQQEEKWINPALHKGEEVPLIVDSMHNGDKETYLKLVKKLGLTPKFPEFVDNPNYMKLVGRESGKFGSRVQASLNADKINFEQANKVFADWVKGGMEDAAIDNAAVKIATEQFGEKVSPFSQKRITKLDEFEKAPGLTAAERSKETKAFEKVIKNEDKIVDEYIEKNRKKGMDKVVNTDDFRLFFKEEGYKGSNAATFQEPASYLGKRARVKLFQNPEKFATIYAGGSGTGKTSAINNVTKMQPIIKNSAIVIDSNLSKMSSANKIIKEAENSGKKPVFIYTYRDPMDSFVNGVVKRMAKNKEEMGRLVPTKVIADNHIGSWEVIKELHDKGYIIKYIDNSLGGPDKAVLVKKEALEKKIKYPTREQLTKELNQKAQELYEKTIRGEEGGITKEQYQGYIE